MIKMDEKKEQIKEAKKELKSAKSEYKNSKSDAKKKLVLSLVSICYCKLNEVLLPFRTYEQKKKKLERLEEALQKLELSRTDKVTIDHIDVLMMTLVNTENFTLRKRIRRSHSERPNWTTWIQESVLPGNIRTFVPVASEIECWLLSFLVISGVKSGKCRLRKFTTRLRGKSSDGPLIWRVVITGFRRIWSVVSFSVTFVVEMSVLAFI